MRCALGFHRWAALRVVVEYQTYTPGDKVSITEECSFCQEHRLVRYERAFELRFSKYGAAPAKGLPANVVRGNFGHRR